MPTPDGRESLDFLAGHGEGLLGPAHPDLLAAVAEAVAAGAPRSLARTFAERLAEHAPGELDTVSLTPSDAEAVEASLALARAATRRVRFVCARRGYHGTTLGALSVSGSRRLRAPFEPLLAGTTAVPYGDLGALEKALRRRDVAAFIVEPIQDEGGIRVPPPGYLADAAGLCRRSGTLVVVDEIGTGLARTGRLFACEHDDLEPDVLLIGRGLGGGLAAVAALVTRADLWARADGALGRPNTDASPLASAAALATLEVIQRDGLAAHAAQLGHVLGARLAAATADRPLVRAVRGRGLFWGIDLGTPAGLGEELVAQWIVVSLRRRGIVTDVCAGAPHVLRVQPGLTIGRAGVDAFASTLSATLSEDAPGTVSSLARAATAVLRGTVTRFVDA